MGSDSERKQANRSITIFVWDSFISRKKGYYGTIGTTTCIILAIIVWLIASDPTDGSVFNVGGSTTAKTKGGGNVDAVPYSQYRYSAPPPVDGTLPIDDNCTIDDVEFSSSDSDVVRIGRCRYPYPKRLPPPKGYLEEIDFFHLREGHEGLENCFLCCIDMLEPKDFDHPHLADASHIGLSQVVAKMKTKLKLDPLFPALGGLNAIQLAIRGGYADVVKVLTDSNNDMVIDEYERTVADYVRMKGSPIRPAEAKRILGLSVDTAEAASRRDVVEDGASNSLGNSGWNERTSFPYDETCDIDVIEDDMSRDVFLKEYFSTGRPFVLRRHVPKSEVAAFSKDRWDATKHFNTSKRDWDVGPTAYPELTDQEHCKRLMTLLEIESGAECEELPGVPVVSAFHPDDAEFRELYPMYSGHDGHEFLTREFYKSSGWRKIDEFFGSAMDWDDHMTWQVFVGGDGSGATLHWHAAAFNSLYVGTKEWRLTPPFFRGFTGMPARKAVNLLDESTTLRCTQHAGDLVYVPEHWGHLTLNHGFTIGAAVLLPKTYHKSAETFGGPRDIPFLFVHINKTGGTSIINMLHDRCGSEYVYERWGGGHRSFHATAMSYIDHYGKKAWDNAYTFTVVRHPLARQVSNFFFLAGRCNRKGDCKERLIPEWVGAKMDDLTDEDKISAFHEWIWDLYQAFPPGSADHYLFGSKGHGNEDNASFNATQTSWLVNENDEIAVKNIYHLEGLSRNMDLLAESIPCLKNEASSDEYESSNSRRLGEKDEGHLKMTHSNTTPKYPDYKLFAKNKRTRKIMKEVYAVDFKNFGYTL